MKTLAEVNAMAERVLGLSKLPLAYDSRLVIDAFIAALDWVAERGGRPNTLEAAVALAAQMTPLTVRLEKQEITHRECMGNWKAGPDKLSQQALVNTVAHMLGCVVCQTIAESITKTAPNTEEKKDGNVMHTSPDADEQGPPVHPPGDVHRG